MLLLPPAGVRCVPTSAVASVITKFWLLERCATRNTPMREVGVAAARASLETMEGTASISQQLRAVLPP